MKIEIEQLMLVSNCALIGAMNLLKEEFQMWNRQANKLI